MIGSIPRNDVSESLLSTRIRDFEGGLFSKITKADVGDTAGKLMRQGYDLLAWADPYFPDYSLPHSVQEAMTRHLGTGATEHYTLPIGNMDLRTRLAEKLGDTFGRKLDPNRNIIITPGSDSGLFFAMSSLINPGDDVVVCDPCYPSNISNLMLLGANPVYLPLNSKDDWQISDDALERVITDNTRAIILTNPNNPTTTVLRNTSLEAISRCTLRHDLSVVCDEAFCDHIHQNLQFTPLASSANMWDRTLTVRSFSKGYGLSGLRVGYIIGNETFMDKLYGSAVNVLGATNSLSQNAALAALDDTTILSGFSNDFKIRAQMVSATLGTIPSITVAPIESGFLSWIDVSRLGTGEEVANYLLENAHVIVNPGSSYGPSGKGHIRIVQGVFKDRHHLQGALNRIRAALIKLAKTKPEGSRN